MHPKLVDAPPARDRWLHEIKYDARRVQIHVDGKAVTTYTRNCHDWTAKSEPIVTAALQSRQAV
jgi:bifunctional non-homologous end joining protein LigD